MKIVRLTVVAKVVVQVADDVSPATIEAALYVTAKPIIGVEVAQSDLVQMTIDGQERNK